MELVIAYNTQVKARANFCSDIFNGVISRGKGCVDDLKVGHIKAHGNTEVDGLFAHFIIIELSLSLPG